MNLDSFVGNVAIVDRLKSKLRQDRFPHALIFSGPAGVGKHTLALMLAKSLNCRNSGPQTSLSLPLQDPSVDLFCDTCSICRRIDTGTHPDVISVAVEEDASQIKIAQIRQILSVMEFHPLEGRNKVFIIDPAGLMNSDAANALLKGLEEPPEHTFFILITVNVHELLTTVRSRCQTYNFSPLTLAEIRSHGIVEELQARWSGGSIGRALNLDLNVLKQEREELLSFLETAVKADVSDFREMFAASAELSRSKQDFPNHLAILSVLLTDLLYLSEGITEQIVNVDLRDRLDGLAKRAGTERLIHMAEFIKFIEYSMKNYVNRQMLTEMLAMVGNESTSKILHDNPGKSR